MTQQETSAATQEEETPAAPPAETLDKWVEADSASDAGTTDDKWGLVIP